MQKINFIILIIWLFVGCKDPYNMNLRSGDQSMLVVEGFLNKGNTSTFQLSRTVDISSVTTKKPELHAAISVEGRDDNTSSYFIEQGNGAYTANLSFLEVGKEYRLRIHTNEGKEYLSDYVQVKNNPAIDSVSWKQSENNDVQVSISTHDPGNNTRYYRWEYDETWEIRSVFYSSWKYKKDSIVERELPKEDVSVCWKYNSSRNILLGSSAKLSADIIKEHPLITIPRTSDQLEQRYSILVRQYTMTKEAYEYLELLKKNTESLGSIFDAQPSEVRGNIHCISDPKEQVIGFVTASAVQEQRIFIRSTELKGPGHYLYCETFEIPNNPDSIEAYAGFYPYSAQSDGNHILSWFASYGSCVDCTTRGGSTKKPSYW